MKLVHGLEMIKSKRIVGTGAFKASSLSDYIQPSTKTYKPTCKKPHRLKITKYNKTCARCGVEEPI